MAFVGPKALTELWAKTKSWFGRKLGASTTATTVSIQLKNESGDSLGDAATIPAATNTAAGAMSADDKSKLSGIEAQANKYVHPSHSSQTGNPTANQTPGFGSTFTVSQVTSDSEGHVTGMTDRTVEIPDALVTASTNGSGGSSGLMSPSDKEKLDGIETEANKTVVDSSLSTTSTNPVQNKVVKSALDGKADSSHTHAASDVTSGTFDAARIPNIEVAKGGTGATTAAQARVNLDVYSKSEVESLVTGGAAFKGTLAASNADYTQAQLESSEYKAGWYWVVKTAGTFVGQVCEAGDMVYAIKTKASGYSASDFSVVQNNLTEMTEAEVDAICV